MSVKQFRKKPVVIEAIRFDGTAPTASDIFLWAGSPPIDMDYDEETNTVRSLTITTLEGKMTASVGDWIIRGVYGEYYPCKPDIFDATYEEVKEQ